MRFFSQIKFFGGNALLGRFRKAASGNLSITFALSAVPIVFALGATTDYGYAVKTRSQMNAAADAAALTAVSAAFRSQPTTVAQAKAVQMFNSQVADLRRLTYDPTNLTVTVTDAVGTNQTVRTAVVTYSAQSQTAFSGIIKMNTIAIAGTATATAATTPNIDFYLMLDTSPSMAIPSSQDGIDRMVALTPKQDSGGGCAFACHETSPQLESETDNNKPAKFGNPGCPDDPKKGPGPCLDNYQLALNNNISLRIQLVNQAVVNLVDTAKYTASQTNAAYQLAGYTFDVAVGKAFALQAPSDTTKTQAQANINMLVVDHENSSNGDQNTIFDTTTSKTTSPSSAYASTSAGALPYIYNTMTTANNGLGAGAGTNTTGDRPQQVLMLVTDGVSDQPWTSNARIYNPLGGATNTSSDINDWCTKIKANTNMRIAVLYLVYIPLPLTDGKKNPTWYSRMVSPIQSDIAPTLKNCASPGLFYQVNNGGDISTALGTLFQSAAGGAHLAY